MKHYYNYRFFFELFAIQSVLYLKKIKKRKLYKEDIFHLLSREIFVRHKTRRILDYIFRTYREFQFFRYIRYKRKRHITMRVRSLQRVCADSNYGYLEKKAQRRKGKSHDGKLENDETSFKIRDWIRSFAVSCPLSLFPFYWISGFNPSSSSTLLSEFMLCIYRRFISFPRNVRCLIFFP